MSDPRSLDGGCLLESVSRCEILVKASEKKPKLLEALGRAHVMDSDNSMEARSLRALTYQIVASGFFCAGVEAGAWSWVHQRLVLH